MKIFKRVCSVFYLVAILSAVFLTGCPQTETPITTRGELIDAFKNGGIYIIAQDIPLSYDLTVANGTNVELKCTKEHGAHTITHDGDGIVVEQGTLSLGTGDALLTISYKGSYAIIQNSGNLSINAGIKLINGDIWNWGKLEINGGSIYGGEVWNMGSFKMNDGEIYGSNKDEGIGVWNSSYKGSVGTFTMAGGAIFNKAVGVANDTTFTMTGGKIYGNSSGVSNSTNAKFTMKDGEIYSNNLDGVSNNGNFVMNGGKIYKNSRYGLYNNHGTYGGSALNNIYSNSVGNIYNKSGGSW